MNRERGYLKLTAQVLQREWPLRERRLYLGSLNFAIESLAGSLESCNYQELWKISRRAATNRLKEMCAQGLLVEMSTGPRDPTQSLYFSRT